MASDADLAWMRAAMQAARTGLAAGEPPFGAVVVDAAGREVARAHDQVTALRDMRRHSEIEAVRAACAARGPDLSGCTLYATTEPCAMCFTSAWLARVSRIVYGCTMAEVAAVAPSQREVPVPVAVMNAATAQPLALEGGVLGRECLAMFEAWAGT
ncbi:MAG: nucleoside deaminase [Betaproteobacteria bacterium]